MGFGARLREKRLEKGLTQEQLGQGLGTDGKDVGKAVVYGWEKDQHFPKVDQLAILCERFNWSADYLIRGQVSFTDLRPEVAELASELNQLQPAQIKFVLDVLKPTLVHARQIGAPESPLTPSHQDGEASQDEASSQRRVSR